MNDIENNYKALEMPNILYEEAKVNSGPIIDKDIQTHPFMLPLVKRIARARPQWTIITAMNGIYTSGDGYVCSSFKIYEGKTQLGRIYKGYGRLGDTAYAIDNDRLNADRKRGGTPSTKDVAKAFKMVIKSFHGQTVDEAFREAHSEASITVSSLFNNSHGKFLRKYTNLNEFMVGYVMKNWDHMQQAAIDAGVSPTALDGMQEAYTAYVDTKAIRAAWNNSEGVTVLIRGDDYIVDSPTGKHILDGDKLTVNIKRSLGILKMVDINTYVADHGVRVGKNKFFVSSKEQIK